MPQDDSEQNSQAFAPWLTVPSRSLVTVEHPGSLRNYPRTLESLGGEKRLGESLNANKSDHGLHLFFHPTDPFRRPLTSTMCSTNDLVVKFTVPKCTGRKRKRGSNDPFVDSQHSETPGLAPDSVRMLKALGDNPTRYHAEVVGGCRQTHRFRSLPDFQYATAGGPMADSLRENIMSFDYDKIQNFKLDTTTRGTQPNMEIFPPPIFSQSDIPFNYQYRQNPSVKLVVDASGRQSALNTSVPKRTIVQLVNYDAATIPELPSPDLQPEVTLDMQSKQVIRQIRRLQEERPIFTRRVLRNLLPGIADKDIQAAVQYVGYSFRSGPWRESIVKLGLDPRKHVECRMYQTRSFQIATTYKRSEMTEQTAIKQARGYQRPFRAEPGDHTSHLFDGQKVIPDGKVWQCCDVTEPSLRDLLQSDLPRQTCELRSDGWFHNGTWAKFHVIMRDMITQIMAGNVPDVNDYRNVITEIPAEIDIDDIQQTFISHRPDVTSKEQLLATEIRVQLKEANAKRTRS